MFAKESKACKASQMVAVNVISRSFKSFVLFLLPAVTDTCIMVCLVCWKDAFGGTLQPVGHRQTG